MTTLYLFPIFVPQGKSKTRYKVGYINSQGTAVLDAVFDEGTRFYEGLASVEVQNRWGVIDTKGEFVIQPTLWNWCQFRGGLASVATRNGKWGIIDRNGDFLVKPRYDYLDSFREGLVRFRVGEGAAARYGFLNKTGSEAIQPAFHDAKHFSEGLAAVKVGGLWGYITPTGVFQIAPRIDGSGKAKRWLDTRAGYFTDGLAPIWVSQDKYRFINTAGAFAFDGSFDEANTFAEGRALIKRNDKFGFVDQKGTLVIDCKFTSARDFSAGLARVTEKEPLVGSYPPSGFINLNGEMVIQPTFYSANSFYDGLCLVETEKTIGYINPAGEFVWQGPFVDYGVVI